jgi:hypothetical protein
VGSHAELTTLASFLRFRDYLARGGAVMIHGGDSFAVIMEHLPSAEEPRYLWQRDHVWMHLTYQDDGFLPPQLLQADASASAPTTSPDAGAARSTISTSSTSAWHTGRTPDAPSYRNRM